MVNNTTIRLDSGIDIRLDHLFQYRTYAGLLEGLPTRKLNADLVRSAVGYATEKLWLRGTPHLLAPNEVSMDLPEDKWFRPGADYEPAQIPPITCLAMFESRVSARDPNADCSSLGIVWFQDAFGPPVDANVLRQFQSLDWRALATDGYW